MDISANSLPADWRVIEFFDLRDKSSKYSFTGGPFGSDLKSEHYQHEGVRVIQLQDIGEGEFLDKSSVYISEEKADELISANIYPGEIILAKMAPVGRCCKVPRDNARYVMCSDGIRLSIDKLKYDPEFVFQMLNSTYFRKEVSAKSTGTTRERIGLSDLKEVKLHIPVTLEEQTKIATILSKIDSKIELISKEIAQTNLLKKGLMQQLLTKGIGHTKFKSSPLGNIPESWAVKPLAEICENPRKKFSDTNGYCIELEHIEQETGQLKSFDNYEDKLSVKSAFRKQDILFCKLRPYLRKYWYADFEGACTSELLVFRAKAAILSKLLFYIVQQESFISYAVANSYGTKMPRTSWDVLSEFSVLLPPIEEQNEIVNILKTIDEKIEILEVKKNLNGQLKRGLMQQLLTGKIRVKVDDEIPVS